jgi:hypothetical protein
MRRLQQRVHFVRDRVFMTGHAAIGATMRDTFVTPMWWAPTPVDHRLRGGRNATKAAGSRLTIYLLLACLRLR